MNLTADISRNNLVINKLTKELYDALYLSSLINDNEIYLVEDTELDAQNKKITNLLSGTLSSDAANLYLISSLILDSSNLLSTMFDEKILSVNNNLSDFYKKNETSSASLLSILENQVNEKIQAGIYANELSNVNSLSIINIDTSSYFQIVLSNQVSNDTLYIISSENTCNFGERITDVAEPINASDAATKNYVDLSFEDYVKETDLSIYCVSADNTVNLQIKGNLISAKLPESSSTTLRVWDI